MAAKKRKKRKSRVSRAMREYALREVWGGSVQPMAGGPGHYGYVHAGSALSAQVKGLRKMGYKARASHGDLITDADAPRLIAERIS